MRNHPLKQFNETIQVDGEKIFFAFTEVHVLDGDKFFISGIKDKHPFGFEIEKKGYAEKWKIDSPSPQWAQSVEAELATLITCHIS